MIPVNRRCVWHTLQQTLCMTYTARSVPCLQTLQRWHHQIWLLQKWHNKDAIIYDPCQKMTLPYATRSWSQRTDDTSMIPANSWEHNDDITNTKYDPWQNTTHNMMLSRMIPDSDRQVNDEGVNEINCSLWHDYRSICCWTEVNSIQYWIQY